MFKTILLGAMVVTVAIAAIDSAKAATTPKITSLHTHTQSIQEPSMVEHNIGYTLALVEVGVSMKSMCLIRGHTPSIATANINRKIRQLIRDNKITAEELTLDAWPVVSSIGSKLYPCSGAAS